MPDVHDPQVVLAAAIAKVAPEVDLGEIDVHADLRDEAQLDSLDVLNIVAAIFESTGVEIPERDYPSLATVSTFVEYLAQRL